MIDTLSVRKEQVARGYFTVGKGPEHLLILGSCRAVPYLNYFDYLSHLHKFTVHFIDPFNWHWDEDGVPIPYEPMINSLEKDARILDLLKSCRWFIHEYYENFGMFNTGKDREKNIYQFGVAPEVDIMLPNFNDLLILFQDVISFDDEIRLQAGMEIMKGGFSRGLQDRIKEVGLASVEKFCGVCRKTDFPEMETLFRGTWRIVRYFGNLNHITNEFTIALFQLLNQKFLHLEIPDVLGGFWDRVSVEDLYLTPRTPITKYDVDNHGIQWNEPMEELRV